MHCDGQVLAGAGPAVAAVPLVVVWAGGSAVNLVQGIARRQVGPRGTASRIGFVAGQSIAQVRARLPSLPLPPHLRLPCTLAPPPPSSTSNGEQIPWELWMMLAEAFKACPTRAQR